MFIEQRMCLNLPTQTNVCSLAWVLKCGFSFFSMSGLKFFLHSGDIWFAKWNTSITFSTLDQDKSSGGGSGRGLCATLSLAKLHMLSYANVTWGMCWELFSRANNHCSTIRNTWDGDSDLHLERRPKCSYEYNKPTPKVWIFECENSPMWDHCFSKMVMLSTNWQYLGWDLIRLQHSYILIPTIQ